MGRNAALEDTEKIIEALEGADMVFVTTGLGGGTGTGAAPIIASLATELNALTVAVMTEPFHFEGKRRMTQSDRTQGIARCVDTVITILTNGCCIPLTATFVQDAFKLADDVFVRRAGHQRLITVPGLINLDFADVKAIMSGWGCADGRGARERREPRAEATQHHLVAVA